MSLPSVIAAQKIDTALARARDGLLALQARDGHWVGELEADSSITSEWIMLQHLLGRVDRDREARAVPITPELRPWLERREGEEWFAVNSFRRAWLAFPDDLLAECFKTAKIAGGHPHILRHTYASTWLSRGGDVYTLSKVLGHADVRLTLETYAHLIPGHLQASAGIVTYGATVGPAAAAGAARGLTSVPPALPGGPPTRPKRR